jgi:hypothetical protein
VNTSLGCAFEHADGAYVLGALSAAERLAFERHLAGCDACTARVRQLAGLPGLLGRVGAEVLEDTELPDLPPTLLPALATRVRRDQRRRTALTALVAAAATAAVVGLGAVALDAVRDDRAPSTTPTATPTADAGTAMSPVGGAAVPVRANLTLEDVAWGTRIGLLCTYDPEAVEYELPAEVTYLLVVTTRDGGTEQIGTWRSIGGRTMRLEAGTATRQEDIASVEVRTTDGRVVLTTAA